jgi:SNF2 family DNA or RNA helicase
MAAAGGTSLFRIPIVTEPQTGRPTAASSSAASTAAASSPLAAACASTAAASSCMRRGAATASAHTDPYPQPTFLVGHTEEPGHLELTPQYIRACGFLLELFPHQVDGVQWLLLKEGKTWAQRTEDCGYGILGDEMGLGKTIECIVLTLVSSALDAYYRAVVTGGPILESQGPTLVVVPKSVLLQWQQEILNQCDGHTLGEPTGHDLVYLYRSKQYHRQELNQYARMYPSEARRVTPSILKRSAWWASSILAKKRFVITTYNTVQCDFDLTKRAKPKKQKPTASSLNEDGDHSSSDEDDDDDDDDQEDADDGGDNEEREFFKRAGPLYHVHWGRIILDEGHIIRNIKSSTTRAVMALRGKRRLVSTGTLFNNRSLDLCTPCIFLRISPYNEPKWWANNQHDPRAILKWRTKYHLRRTKQLLIEQGRMKPKTIETIPISLSAQHQDIYTTLLRESMISLGPSLSSSSSRSSSSGKNNKKHRDRDNEKHSTEVKCQLLDWLQKLRQVCNDPLLMFGRDATLPFSKLSRRSRRQQDNASFSCGICEKMCFGRHARFPSCGHSICMPCFEGANDPDQDDDQSCRFCERAKKPSQKTKCLIKMIRQSLAFGFVPDMDQHPVPHPVSERPIQVLVISQWSSYLDLVELELRRKGISHQRYDGDIVSAEARNEVVKDFQAGRQGTQVLLLNVHAGGVGLNLTAASVVFECDAWYNPSKSMQAIDRVHRIGQERDVHVYRLMSTPCERVTRLKVLVEDFMRRLRNRKSDAIEYYEGGSGGSSKPGHADDVPPADEHLRGIFDQLIALRNGGEKLNEDDDDDDDKEEDASGGSGNEMDSDAEEDARGEDLEDTQDADGADARGDAEDPEAMDDAEEAAAEEAKQAAFIDDGDGEEETARDTDDGGGDGDADVDESHHAFPSEQPSAKRAKHPSSSSRGSRSDASSSSAAADMTCQ